MQQLEQKIKLKEIKRCIKYKGLGSGSMSDPAYFQIHGSGSKRKIGQIQIPGTKFFLVN